MKKDFLLFKKVIIIVIVIWMKVGYLDGFVFIDFVLDMYKWDYIVCLN